MTRLIDVDKLKQYIDDCVCCEKCEQNYFKCYEHCELPDFLTPQWERVLNEQPTVDAEPVRHGKWLPLPYDSGGYWKCSDCGTPTEASGANVLYKYCPFCGAKMEAEQDE